MPQRADISQLPGYQLLTPEGRQYVDSVRNSPPARRVGSRQGNVCGHFPSRKMGHTVQYDSRHGERVFAVGCEYADTIVEYWDQPQSIKLRYRTAKGRAIGHLHTSDYLVIEDGAIYLVECKESQELDVLSAEAPERFCKDTDGRWISPAGKAATSQYGIGYRVWTPEDASTIFVRNIDYLRDYIDSEPPIELSEGIDKLIAVLEDRKWLAIEDARTLVGNADIVHWAIATQRVYFDLSNDLVVTPRTSHIFIDAIYHRVFTMSSDSAESHVSTGLLTAEPGASLLWDGVLWKVLNVSINIYTLRSEKNCIVTLSESDFAALVRDGHLAAVNDETAPRNAAAALLLKASDNDLKTATYRAKQLECADLMEDTNGHRVSKRTLRYWRKKKLEAEAATGIGYLGLLPRTADRGNRTSRLTADQQEQINISLITDFLSASARSVREAYEQFVTRCREAAISCVSYNTYLKHAKAISEREKAERRHGQKAAYQVGPIIIDRNVGPDVLPAHGERPFDVAHIDHTELEIELVSELTGEVLGRPWASFMLDAGSRMPLASVLTFESPSVRTLMMILRDCVRRNGRLPCRIVVDQGSEFNSTYFEMLLAMYGIEKVERPPSEPRYGAPAERFFGTTQSKFIHTLVGNTKNSHLARSLSATHSPSRHAIWTPDAFTVRMNDWLFEVYPELPHFGILETPRKRMERLATQSGIRAHKFIPYDETFIIATMPSPNKSARIVRPMGIQFNHLNYSGPELNPYIGKKIKTQIRYDPYDASYIYAYIDGRWVKLYTTSWLFHDYSDREIRQIHMEVFARARNTGRDYRAIPTILTNFLGDIRNQERRLVAQKAAMQLRTAALGDGEFDNEPTQPATTVNVATLQPFKTVRI